MNQSAFSAQNLSTPFSIVLRYFLSAFLFYTTFFVLIFQFFESLKGYFLSFQIAFLAHVFFLGFVLNTIFGAMFQLLPVALERPIFSIFLAKLQFYIYESGIILMLYGFYNVNLDILTLGALFTFISIAIYLFNFFASIIGSSLNKLEVKFLIVSHALLGAGAVIGLVMALNMRFNFLSIDYVDYAFMHITFMIFGFIFMSIMGLSKVLLPMFSLAHKYSDKPLKTAFYTMLFGIIGFAMSMKLLWIKEVFFGIVLTGIGIYLIQVLEIYRHKPKKRADIYINGMFYSHIFVILGVPMLLYSPIFFGILMSIGFLQMFILSNLYKIVPFLVWFHRFSRLVGKKKVPMLSDMLKKPLSMLNYTFSSTGVILITISLVFNIKALYIVACGFLLAGAASFLTNILYVLTLK